MKLVAEPPVTAVDDEFETVNALDPVVRTPLVNVKVPPTATAIESDTPAELFIPRLLNVVDELPPIVCNEPPIKLTDPVPAA